MTLLAIPNVSEGRDRSRIASFASTVEAAGTRVLDTHSDETHNRSVYTLTGTEDQLVASCTALADASRSIDLETHSGIHPRLGGLDVCPFVPYQSSIDQAIACARRTAAAIGEEVGLPVYLYGSAATRAETRELPDLRRGGLHALAARALAGLVPDHGPQEIDLHRGIVCVGARGPLIAFNVWLKTNVERARHIAKQLRGPSVRALGLSMDTSISQVSMNLIEPEKVGLEEVFAAAVKHAEDLAVEVAATEIVGLVEQRFLPGPDATVTRLLLEPGHCLEDRLKLY